MEDIPFGAAKIMSVSSSFLRRQESRIWSRIEYAVTDRHSRKSDKNFGNLYGVCAKRLSDFGRTLVIPVSVQTRTVGLRRPSKILHLLGQIASILRE